MKAYKIETYGKNSEKFREAEDEIWDRLEHDEDIEILNRWDRIFKSGVRKVKKVLKEMGIEADIEQVNVVKCVSCKVYVIEEDDYGTWVEDGYLCQACEEYERTEPPATVYFYNDDEYEEDMPYVVGHYINETEGKFWVSWVRCGGWRGYYEAYSDEYEKIHDDGILAYSEDAEELENFDEIMTKAMKKAGIRFARVFTRSSNVFFMGYELWVHKDDMDKFEKLKKLLNEAIEKYRNATRFTITALTGKDPSECTEEEKLWAIISGMILDL